MLLQQWRRPHGCMARLAWLLGTAAMCLRASGRYRVPLAASQTSGNSNFEGSLNERLQQLGLQVRGKGTDGCGCPHRAGGATGQPHVWKKACHSEWSVGGRAGHSDAGLEVLLAAFPWPLVFSCRCPKCPWWTACSSSGPTALVSAAAFHSGVLAVQRRWLAGHLRCVGAAAPSAQSTLTGLKHSGCADERRFASQLPPCLALVTYTCVRAAYELGSGRPVYNTFLVGRSLKDGGAIWAANMSALGGCTRGLGGLAGVGG